MNKPLSVTSPLLGLYVALCAVGCALGPDHVTPGVVLPDRFVTEVPAVVVADESTWWGRFQDPILSDLVVRARDSNLSLAQAEARLRQAREGVQLASSRLWPSIDASGSYRRSGEGSALRASDGAESGVDLFRLGFDAAWELDIFGGNRRRMEAAEAEAEATSYELQDVQLSVTAEVVSRYFSLRTLQERIRVARENLRIQGQSANITRERFGVGFASSLDVANAEALIATTQSVVPQLESLAQQQIFAISVLLALPPGELMTQLSSFKDLPQIPEPSEQILPSELLRRRPDIRAAEERLHSATAQVGVAVADLFPKFSLAGAFGVSDKRVSMLDNFGYRIWSAGSDIALPIIDGGYRRAVVRVQEAAKDEYLALYKNTVPQALQDAETALVAHVKERERVRSLETAVARNRDAVRVSLELYQKGLGEFTEVLLAERALYAAEDALSQNRDAQAQNIVALYKSLGGSW